ncbi:MAG: hypothetical protein H7X93_05150 [Sphingomonadaceae bacterium]|nr:hypothetical protein [Sphingomonadaceae bacterium]
MNLKFHRLLLAATALAGAVPAHSQVSADVAAEIAALRAQIDALEAQVAEIRTASAAAPAPAAEGPEIRFRGAPQITAPGGWSFKPRGRIQYDAGFVSSPDGISDPGLGFSNELRRGRLGVEGTIPGGFGYVFEMDFADNNVDITDAILTYKASDLITFTAGQHNNFQSLEELTSSRFSSFIERAAFTDAFNFERRVGLSGTLTSGDLLVQGGVFTDNINDLTDDGNNAIGADARVVYAPSLGENTRLHFGASGHWRNNRDLPEDGFTTRYRQRPLVHSTDVRFIATPTLSVENETHYGLEAAIIAGPFHAVGEVHWLDANPLGTGSDYSFFGGYAEVGYFITGESRGYRGGRFDRTSVEKPVGEGGLGALQVNLRYDHVDLTSNVVVGGSQDGFQGSLIWIPTDYVRFMINYARLQYDDAALIAVDGDRDYAVDVLGARAQIDF